MSANDPEIPDSCPKCGANRLPSDYSAAFACGTLVSSKGNYHHTITCHHFSEFRKPLDAERDALAARVKELEPYEAICKNPAALWTNWLRGTVALPAGIGDVRQEQARVRELEVKLEEWKAYAGRLEGAASTLRDHLFQKVDTCRNCQGSGQNNDGEGLLDEACPDCEEDRIALALYDDRAKEAKP